MRIVLLIRSLNLGGTERQVVLLARGLKARGYDVAVMLFFASGTALERELASADIRLVALGKRGRWDVVAFVPRLIARLRAERPDALYAFLPVANVLAVLARPFLRGARIILGVRASNMDLARYDGLSRFSYWLEGKLARFSHLSIANSAAGRELAIARGFPAKAIVVPNGIDGERFRPDATLRRATRAGWGIADGATLIGVVARLDPMKGHAVFLDAAWRMRARRGDLRFVCVGSGPEEATLRAATRARGFADDLAFVPERTDVEAALNALDLLVLPSAFGEGFPNVLGEAMACGIPCVATDLGAARQILGNEGAIVAPGDAAALADACLRALVATDGEASSRRRRERVLALYGAEAMVARTAVLLSGEN